MQQGSRILAAFRLFRVLLFTSWAIVRLLVHRLWNRDIELLRFYTRYWSEGLLKIANVKVEVRGEAPQGRGVLIVANHRSYTDIPALLSVFHCSFLAMKEVSTWLVIGWAARLGETVFVDRDHKDSRRAARDALRERLNQGRSVMVFPSGTTSPRGTVKPFRPGMFHIAAAGALDVVPVAIEVEHPDDAWIEDETFVTHFLRRFGGERGTIVVSFGPVLQDSDGEALRDTVQHWIQEEVQRHSDDSSVSSSKS